nr:MAG TPA: ubiquitin thioesterase [Bacteriophage sp.]
MLIHSAPPFPIPMIQKIRTAKLPGNCLYSAFKLL